MNVLQDKSTGERRGGTVTIRTAAEGTYPGDNPHRQPSRPGKEQPLHGRKMPRGAEQLRQLNRPQSKRQHQGFSPSPTECFL